MLLQALYYWLRTYLMERRDVATKTEMGRNMLAQQRMQQTMLANNVANNLPDGSARGSNHAGGNMTSDNQVHQASQSVGAPGSHDGGNVQGQEPDRSSEGGTNNSHDQGQQSSAGAEGTQVALRRNSGLGWVTSAASAFDAAKDIMEALRSKHTNLANELEVRNNEVFFYVIGNHVNEDVLIFLSCCNFFGFPLRDGGWVHWQC
jgi:transformation/transcription domain-associated protein